LRFRKTHVYLFLDILIYRWRWRVDCESTTRQSVKTQTTQKVRLYLWPFKSCARLKWSKLRVRFKQLICNAWYVHNRLFNAYFEDKHPIGFLVLPGDQEGLFKLAIQLRTFFIRIFTTLQLDMFCGSIWQISDVALITTKWYVIKVKINGKKKSKLEFGIII
jgi:hypothetical protein